MKPLPLRITVPVAVPGLQPCRAAKRPIRGLPHGKKLKVCPFWRCYSLHFGLPLVMTSPTYLHIVILIYFYAYLTSSWNMVGGFAGVLPLGHAVFIGVGAYTSTILSLAIWNFSLDRDACGWWAFHGHRDTHWSSHL